LILYLDTSALVKLYAEEKGSDLVRQAVRASDFIATSLMSYVETRSALVRKGRSREISRPTLTRCRREFDRDWLRLHRLPVDEALVRKAGELAEEHALRALDALHLATADSLQVALRSAITFACFDADLNGAAEARGLAVLTRTQA
jgi:predicted nucleic acid-binding protein